MPSTLSYKVVQPMPGQPWRRVARQCALCTSSLSCTTNARSTLEKGGQTLCLVHKFIKFCNQCQVNLGEGWPDVGIVHAFVSAGSTSATLEKGVLVLLGCT